MAPIDKSIVRRTDPALEKLCFTLRKDRKREREREREREGKRDKIKKKEIE